MNILAVGQSHVAAIRDAARTRRTRDPDRPRTRVIHTSEARYALDPGEPPPIDGFKPRLVAEIRDQIARHQPRLVSVIGGNAHMMLALLRHPRPFDFHLSGEPSPPVDEAAEPIPEALVRASLAERLQQDLAQLRWLRALAGPFLHLESPPPVRDEAMIQQTADQWFRDRAGEAFLVAAPGLRFRMWRLHSRMVAEAVATLGGRFVPVPPAVQDEDGFLRPEFAGNATHGNEAYGEQLIRMIEQLPGVGTAA